MPRTPSSPRINQCRWGTRCSGLLIYGPEVTSIHPRRARPGMEPLFCFSSLSIRIRALSDLPACHMYNAPWYNATSPQLSASILTCISFDEQMLDEYCIGVCVCVCVKEREHKTRLCGWRRHGGKARQFRKADQRHIPPSKSALLYTTNTSTLPVCILVLHTAVRPYRGFQLLHCLSVYHVCLLVAGN